MFEPKETAEEAQQKRLFYLKMIYFVSLAMSAIYLFKFNFEYRVSTYNPGLFSFWIGTALVPPIILYRFKNYRLAALSCGLLATAVLVYLLYLSGGVAAPGIFWLAIVPFGFGVLLSTAGAFIGYTIVFATMVWFWILKLQGGSVNIIAAYGDYDFEKSFNVCTFLMFAGITTHLYLKGEQKYTKRLQEKHWDVENLLRVLLHDVANTLSSMTYNLIKAREDQEQEAPMAQQLDKMERAVSDINNLLHQVRHLKSVKDGKASMPLTPISIAIVLNEVMEKSEALATQKGIKIALDLSRDKMVVNSEKTILNNVVLANLLSNAVKFSLPGDRIDLRAYSTESMAVIEIQDYGIGMPENLLNKIFHLDAATTREGTHGEKGTGYGMPLVKEYLTMMGGSIVITSQEEAVPHHPRGTKVVVKIPLTV
ncbi:sensor histidine kinase KdpD [Bdellovibrio sp. KM01]|uniref:sensor histidine kinase n=1 Tax=Bdellovibrio sp. KM01 TaxID=2748865 RepID=UPI0021071590|nr:HAMP domain-containing sensor histidine kinase [Bdellovibrio sp. KM01]